MSTGLLVLSSFPHRLLFCLQPRAPATPHSNAYRVGSWNYLAEKPYKPLAGARLLCPNAIPSSYRLVPVVQQALGVLGVLAFHQCLAGRGTVQGCLGLL